MQLKKYLKNRRTLPLHATLCPLFGAGSGVATGKKGSAGRLVTEDFIKEAHFKLNLQQWMCHLYKWWYQSRLFMQVADTPD